MVHRAYRAYSIGSNIETYYMDHSMWYIGVTKPIFAVSRFLTMNTRAATASRLEPKIINCWSFAGSSAVLCLPSVAFPALVSFRSSTCSLYRKLAILNRSLMLTSNAEISSLNRVDRSLSGHCRSMDHWLSWLLTSGTQDVNEVKFLMALLRNC